MNRLTILTMATCSAVLLSACGTDADAFGTDTATPTVVEEGVEDSGEAIVASTTAAPTTSAAPSTTAAPATTTTAPPPPTAAAPTTTTTAPPPTPTTAPTAAPPATESGETVSQRNVRRSAADYLDYSSFSRSGLIDQLEYEGFTTADATYGADTQNADWREQAAKKAEEYLEYSSFSGSGLLDQLLYEGFSPAEAEYGVSTTGL